MKDFLVLPAVEAEFPRLMEFAEKFACRYGLPDDDRLRLLIILEELFTNTVRYGYPKGGPNGRIEVTIAAKLGQLEIDFCDDGIPFDPLAGDLPMSQSPPGVRPEGGQGLRIIRSLTHRARYRREGGRNRLALIRKLDG